MSNETYTSLGRPPENRRQSLVKLMWIGIWLAFMGAPVSDLAGGGHTAWATAGGAAGLTAFIGCYLALVFRHTGRPMETSTVAGALITLFLLALVLSLTLGSSWLPLFVYVSVSSGAALPLKHARLAIPAITVVMVLVGLRAGDARGLVSTVAIPSLIGGFAMTGIRQLVRTTVELRQARATVAELAANEERLRLARDLHDLLGHSLSLITLKSELAGRMLPAHPDHAAEQVADIERVSRQALMDVREAVTGYRRPTLPGELAGARTAFAVAGVDAEVPSGLPDGLGDTLSDECEAALAWSLREAVTNVVRHSGADRCAVSFTPRQTLDGPVVELSVEDNGTGANGAARGNGLTGLTERLALVGGALEVREARKGFVLTARVPVGAGAPAGTGGPGTTADGAPGEAVSA